MSTSLPHASRKEIFDALFALIKTIKPPLGASVWKTAEQKLVIWDEVPSASQPAIYLHRGLQRADQKSGYGVVAWKWMANIWIYYRVEGYKTANTYPDQITDEILDNIETTFATDPINGPITLNGMVKNVWIDGSIAFDSGLNDGQAVIVIPISLLV